MIQMSAAPVLLHISYIRFPRPSTGDFLYLKIHITSLVKEICLQGFENEGNFAPLFICGKFTAIYVLFRTQMITNRPVNVHKYFLVRHCEVPLFARDDTTGLKPWRLAISCWLLATIRMASLNSKH